MYAVMYLIGATLQLPWGRQLYGFIILCIAFIV